MAMGVKSVNSVVRGLTKIVEDLAKISARTQVEIEATEETLAVLKDENARARKIEANLNKLLGE